MDLLVMHVMPWDLGEPLYKLVQTCTDLYKLVKTKLVQTYTNLYKLVETCTTL